MHPSAGADALVILWNAATAEAQIEIPFPDIIYSVSFNYDGSLFACTCKDKFTRVVDPRKGEVIAEGMTHAGIKPQQCVFVKGGRVFTTGFSKNARRQYALWKQVRYGGIAGSFNALLAFYCVLVITQEKGEFIYVNVIRALE